MNRLAEGQRGTPRISTDRAAYSQAFGPFSERRRDRNWVEERSPSLTRERPPATAERGQQANPPSGRQVVFGEPHRGALDESSDDHGEEGAGEVSGSLPADLENSHDEGTQDEDQTSAWADDMSSSEPGSRASAADGTWSSGGSGRSMGCPTHAEQRLLDSIALEQRAIAHLIRAEAVKAQAVAAQRLSPLTSEEWVASQRSLARVLELALETEKILLRKLRLLLFETSPDYDYDPSSDRGR